MPFLLLKMRCALTTPFHPYQIGGIFSVALSLGLPPPGVTRHPDPVEPGLSSPRTARMQAAAIRPSDSGRIIGAAASGGQGGGVHGNVIIQFEKNFYDFLWR